MKKRVLIVNHNKWVREAIKEIIEDEIGLEVYEASNVKKLLISLQNKTFDLLIVDKDMPELNALEVIDKLRASNSSIPIIVISGVLDNSTRECLNGIKSIHIFEIPYSLVELAETVENIVV